VALLERGAAEAGLKAEEIFREPRLRRLAGHETFKKFLETAYGSAATAMAAEIHRELSDISGKWDVSAGPFPFGPVLVAQQGSDVIVTFEKNDNVNYPGAKAGSQQFEGARRGQRLAGFLTLYGERRDCAKETTKVKAELVLSDDGLEMVSLPPRHYLSGRGSASSCTVKAEDNDYYYWTRDVTR
jgi:hypothetical protein